MPTRRSPARQRRPVRHRHDPVRRRLLLCRGRRQHAGARAMTTAGRNAAPRSVPPRLSRRAPAVLAARPASALGARAAMARPGRRRFSRSRRRSSRSGARIRPASSRRQQSHTYFAALDLSTEKRERRGPACCGAWTEAAARMTAGATAKPLPTDPTAPAGDSGEALDLAPARLTVTFGFGAGLFLKDGTRPLRPRRAPAGGAGRPAALQRRSAHRRAHRRRLSVQACADDPQVAFHAVRQLARLAYGTSRRCAGRKPASCSRPARRRRRAT